jgi:hypothetical protein
MTISSSGTPRQHPAMSTKAEIMAIGLSLIG